MMIIVTSHTFGRSNSISGSEQPPAPILGDFGRVGSVLGSFCPYDAVCPGFRVAVEFRVYVRGRFAHTIQTDSPIRLAPRPAANPPKMLLGSRNPLGLALGCTAWLGPATWRTATARRATRRSARSPRRSRTSRGASRWLRSGSRGRDLHSSTFQLNLSRF